MENEAWEQSALDLGASSGNDERISRQSIELERVTDAPVAIQYADVVFISNEIDRRRRLEMQNLYARIVARASHLLT